MERRNRARYWFYTVRRTNNMTGSHVLATQHGFDCLRFIKRMGYVEYCIYSHLIYIISIVEHRRYPQSYLCPVYVTTSYEARMHVFVSIMYVHKHAVTTSSLRSVTDEPAKVRVIAKQVA
jgi:hypothetical protein